MTDREIFIEALQKSDSAERAAFLEKACNKETRNRVQELLVQHDKDGVFFLDSPPAVPATAAMPPVAEKPGTQIGPYKLREQIGEGGFGVVYVAQQSKPVRRKVALKIIKPGMDTKDVIARFEAERQALALMDHPNIAKVLDAGATESGLPYFVMELVRGVPITEFCDEQTLSTRERLQLFVDICRAIQHAHQKGIIHRDLKPSNIMVTLDDNRPIPKVIDFGISKALTQQLTDNSIYTAYGQMVGTPLYMAPEQAQMSMRDVDTRSDVYSLGVLLYELLTGTTPFDKETLQKSGFDEMRRIIREVEPPRPSARISTLKAEVLSTVSDKRKVDPRKLSQSLRGELDWIVMKALEKDRNRRYESASAFAADVERYLNDEPVQACPPSVWYRFRKHLRRYRAAVTMSIVVGLALLVVVAAIGWSVRDREAQQARLAGEVDAILDDVERQIAQRKWDDALATAQRAEALLKSGDAPIKTRQRVQELLADLRLVQQLQDAGLLVFDPRGEFDNKSVDEAYRRAFADAGFTIEGVSVELAAERLRSRSRIVSELAVALTSWARFRQHLQPKDRAGLSRKHLLAVAEAIDPHPWRTRLRSVLIKKDGRDDSLLKMLAEADPKVLGPANSLLLVESLRNGNRTDEKVKFLTRVREEYPEDFWINFQLGALSRNSNLKESLVCFRTAHALRPNNVAAFNNVGVALSRLHRNDEAVLCLRKAQAIHPTSALISNSLGSALADQGMFDQARFYWERAAKLNGRYAMPHYDLGRLFMKQGEFGKAVASFKKALEIKPKSAVFSNDLGRALLEQRELSQAIFHFQKAVSLNLRTCDLHHNLGVAYRWQGKPDQAIASFREALKIDPTSSNTNHLLGVTLLEQGNSRKAIDCFRRAAQFNNRFSDPHFFLGCIYHKQGDVAQAIASFKKALFINPKSSKAHHELGVVLLRQGKPKEGIACLRRAVELDDQFASAHFNLGSTLALQGRWDAAVKSYENYVKLVKPSLSEEFQLALLYAVTNDWTAYRKRCHRLIERSRRQRINLSQAALLASCCTLGAINSGDRAKIIALLRTILAKKPGDRRFRTRLAAALYRAGKYSESRRLLQELLRHPPNHTSNRWFWLAMVEAKMGLHRDARISLRTALASAETRRNTKRPISWWAKLDARLLENEARRVVLGSPVEAPKPRLRKTKEETSRKN